MLGWDAVCEVLAHSNSSQGRRRRQTTVDAPSLLRAGKAGDISFGLGAPKMSQTGTRWSMPSSKLCVSALTAPFGDVGICTSLQSNFADESAMHVATQENARSELERRSSRRTSKAYVPECYVSHASAALCTRAQGFVMHFHAAVGVLFSTPVAATQRLLGACVSEVEVANHVDSRRVRAKFDLHQTRTGPSV